jgi:hypothetical protein
MGGCRDEVVSSISAELRSRPSAYGRLAQLVRALPSHGRGRGFESRIAHRGTPDPERRVGQAASDNDSATAERATRPSDAAINLGYLP